MAQQAGGPGGVHCLDKHGNPITWADFLLKWHEYNPEESNGQSLTEQMKEQMSKVKNAALETWTKFQLERNCPDYVQKIKNGQNQPAIVLPKMQKNEHAAPQNNEVPSKLNNNNNPPSKLNNKASEQFYNMYNYNSDEGIDFYHQFYQSPQQQKQQQQPLLLSPQLQVLPVQYGVNGLNNMNNNGLNHDYNVSNEWLFVLLPILLIAACLCGIICMFLMGFGGLFCYREGQKARVVNERGGFYRKLPQKDDIDMNKRDRGLVHYDESV